MRWLRRCALVVLVGVACGRSPSAVSVSALSGAVPERPGTPLATEELPGQLSSGLATVAPTTTPDPETEQGWQLVYNPLPTARTDGAPIGLTPVQVERLSWAPLLPMLPARLPWWVTEGRDAGHPDYPEIPGGSEVVVESWPRRAPGSPEVDGYRLDVGPRSDDGYDDHYGSPVAQGALLGVATFTLTATSVSPEALEDIEDQLRQGALRPVVRRGDDGVTRTLYASFDPERGALVDDPPAATVRPTAYVLVLFDDWPSIAGGGPAILRLVLLGVDPDRQPWVDLERDVWPMLDSLALASFWDLVEAARHQGDLEEVNQTTALVGPEGPRETAWDSC